MLSISIIIPVYNVEKYLTECLDSITGQSFKDMEIICVDDGSTDASLNILKEYAAKDARLVVVQQENQGAAVARNYGLSLAKGEYVLFLDGDDVFAEKMLEKAITKAVLHDADITVFKAMSFDTNNGNRAVMRDNISRFPVYQIKVFSYLDIPDKIFNSFLIPAWNKLYKRDFLIDNNILFQNVKRYNDMLFTSKSLIMASRIILLDEVLLYYRIGMKGNLQSGKDKTPSEVYKPLYALKSFLEEYGVYTMVKKSFIKLALDNIFYNLNEVKSVTGRKLVVDELRNTIFRSLEIEDNKSLKELSYLGYLQYKYICFGENVIISRYLYALDKAIEYYKSTGFKNTVRKLILKG